MEQDHSLKQSVTFWEALALVVGMIIGSGVFLKPGVVLAEAGSPLFSLLAWVAGGVITLAAALSVAEIAVAIPRSGGLYAYLSELYGPATGYLLGWVQTVIVYPASVAAQSIAFATYAGFFLPLGGLGQRLMALGILAFLLGMNTLSTRCGGVIQIIATVGKLVPVAAIIVFGVAGGLAPGFLSAGGGRAAGFGAAILGTLWAYDGWINVANMAGELKNPRRNLPKVIALGLCFVIAVYALFNLVLFGVLPQDQLAASTAPGAEAAGALFGPGGGAFIAAGIMISVFGSLNGYLMTAARVPQSMGQRRELPLARFLGEIHPRRNTPANSLAAISALAAVYILSGTFHALTDLLIFVMWIFFTMGVFGVFLQRRRRAPQEGQYRVPLYPLTPLVGVAGGGYILVSTLLTNPLRSLTGIAITLAGLPVYAWMRKRNSQQ